MRRKRVKREISRWRESCWKNNRI